METFKTSYTPDIFFKELSKTAHRVLMLDYDGTLAPFVTERDRAVPYPGIRERLNALQASKKTRLLIISGRSIDDLKPLLATDRLPEIWGCHGAERLRVDGEYELINIDEVAVKGLVDADEWAIREGLDRYYEKKPTSLAFHWRGLDEDRVDFIRRKILHRWREASQKFGLVLHEFDGGMEIRVQGINKGVAVRTVLEEIEPNTTVAYLGDDLTDEDAFRAIKGKGLGVLVREKTRKSQADLHITPPGELLDFLDKWLEVCK